MLPDSHFQVAVRRDGTLAFYSRIPTDGTVFAGDVDAFAAYREISVRDKARRAANLARMTPGSTRIRGPMVW
jgi:hypothetical protein